jgi:hypothetical protein
MPIVDIERRRAYSRAYVLKNKEKMSAYRRQLAIENPNIISEYNSRCHRKKLMFPQECRRLARIYRAFV